MYIRPGTRGVVETFSDPRMNFYGTLAPPIVCYGFKFEPITATLTDRLGEQTAPFCSLIGSFPSFG